MKKILAFTLALAMVLSSATMTFAASKEVEALANLKLLLNTTDAEVNADLNRAVGLAMVLKALGYTQEDANAKAEANTFVDMEKYGWAKGFTVLGEELKITNGTSVEPKMFSPSAKLNERAFVAFMLRALGYDVDAAWAKAGEIAKEAGVAETVTENKLTKGEAAVIMYKALMAKVQGDEKGRTLAQKLVDEKKLDKDLAVANGLISGEPEKLTVTAMAENLIEVKVMFDGTVDRATAEKVANYKVKGYTVESLEVMEDEKTVVLTLAKQLSNKKEIELVVSGVKNKAGVLMDKQTVKFTTNDVEAPKVEKVTVTGPKNLQIRFSEPLDKKYIHLAKVFVKQEKATLGVERFTEKSLEDNGRLLNVNLYNSLQDGKEYIVAVGDSKKNDAYPYDYAGYTSLYYEEAITYAKDSTLPEVKVVNANQKEVTFEFTKPVKGLKAKHFSHTFSGYNAVGVREKVDGELKIVDFDSKKAYTKLTVVFYNENGTTDKAKGNALPAGDVKVMVLGKAGSDKVMDNWSNQLADTEFTVSVSADREAPEVVSVEVKDSKTLDVTFTEEVKIKDLAKHWDDLSIQLLDKDGKVVEKERNIKVSRKGKVLTLTFKNEYVGKVMTLSLKDVKDTSLYSNVMSPYTTEIDFVDKSYTFKDIKAEFKKIDTSNFFLYVTFNENMDDSALELVNYTVIKGDKRHKLQGTASFLEGNRKIVAIELTYDKDTNSETDMKFLTTDNNTALEAGLKLSLSNRIKDLAGNSDVNFEYNVDIKNLVAADFNVKSAKAVETTKIEVELSREILEMDYDADNWYVAANTAAGQDNLNGATYRVESVNKKSDKVIELILSTSKKRNQDNETVKYSALPSDAADIDVRLLDEENDFRDIFGNKLALTAATGVVVADKITPQVAKFVLDEAAGVASNETVDAILADGAKTKDKDYADKAMIIAAQEGAITFDPNNNENLDSAAELTATVKIKVSIKLTEKIANATLSTTTYALNQGFSIEKIEGKDSDDANIIEITAKKDIKAKKPKADLQAQVEKDLKEWLGELTVTQNGIIKDLNGNPLNSGAVYDALPKK